MLTNILIKNKSNKALKLNESESTGQKYVFTGCFTQCSTPQEKHVNRNDRIYMESEMLRHLGYLRDKIKTDGCLLGELDHPEGRFDISLKEASHKITDLWYDDKSHQVRGKLELLDTPNGKTAKSLIDSGYPLFVSSRAAGDVNEKTKEVEIANIFTYDLVATPGFSEAKLERVNESLKVNATKFLLESSKKYRVSSSDSVSFGISDPAIYIKKLSEAVDIPSEKTNKNYTMKDLTTPLYEEDAAEQPLNDHSIPQVEDGNVKKIGLEQKPAIVAGDPDEIKSNVDEDSIENTASGKKKSADDILQIKAVTAEDNFETSKSDDILQIKAETGKEDNFEKEDDKKEDKKKEDEGQDNGTPAEDGTTESAGKSKLAKIKKSADKDVEKYEDVIENVMKKENVKESIYQNFPFSKALSPKDFAEFVSMDQETKQKCSDFLIENEIFDKQNICQLWKTPLITEAKMQKNWLKLADPEDIKLFLNEPLDVQNSIEATAKFVVLESKADVDAFWERTGLRQKAAKMIAEKEFKAKYKDAFNPLFTANQFTPYGTDFINMIGESMESE